MVKIKNAIKMPSELVRRTVVVLNIKQIVSQHFYSKKKKMFAAPNWLWKSQKVFNNNDEDEK